MAASVGLLTYGGVWLDRNHESSPWWTLTGAILGVAVGFTHFFRTVSRLGKNNQKS